jgi:chemotaxis protein methyltransferase CheR
MLYRVESLGLSGSVTQILRDLIHQRLGLFYEAAHFDQVADRLAPLVVARGLDSFMDYYYFLKYSEDDQEWCRVMDALAVHETYFWREIDQLRAVVDCVVPQLAACAKPLRIWSVPCASGEEPLTVAMLLAEAGWFDRLPIEIYGSDASPHAVARAKEGRYGQRSFRTLPAQLQEKYFVRADDHWTVSPELRSRVSYDIVNLVAEDEVRRHASAPIIFCRNVFIYFSEDSIRRVMAVLEQTMPVPGYLCVAAAESLLKRTVSFELQDIGGSFIYVKNGHSRAPHPTRPRVERAS